MYKDIANLLLTVHRGKRPSEMWAFQYN